MSHHRDDLEIEVKFFLPDRSSLRQKILDTGAAGQGDVFEFNARFDDPGESIKKAASILRLRKDARTILTFKRRPSENNDQFKVHRELEVTVDSFEVMAQILQSLGFYQCQIYEKRRETFLLQQSLLCLDRMPFGDFLEIEGPGTEIRSIADRLELDWDHRILHTYLEIFAEIQRELVLPFTDITFENFKNVRWRPADFMRRFAAA